MKSFETPKNPSKFSLKNKSVSMIGAPFCWGQPKSGVEKGVDAIREAGILRQVQKLGWVVHDAGDVVSSSLLPNDVPAPAGSVDIKRPLTVGSANKKIFNSCSEAASRGDFVLTLGGDHSIAIGSIAGHRSVRNDLCVVWVDAHADINTSDTTPSGNIHGMPVSWLLGLEKRNIPGFEWTFQKPWLGPHNIVYIGLRDLDDGEKETLKRHNIKAFTMTDVDRHGIGAIVEMALDHVNPYRLCPIHLSFDVDALDPMYAPSTGTRVHGGLTFREGHYICEALAETGLLAGLDIVEVNPSIGSKQDVAATVSVACSLVRSSLGETLL